MVLAGAADEAAEPGGNARGGPTRESPPFGIGACGAGR